MNLRQRVATVSAASLIALGGMTGTAAAQDVNQRGVAGGLVAAVVQANVQDVEVEVVEVGDVNVALTNVLNNNRILTNFLNNNDIDVTVTDVVDVEIVDNVLVINVLSSSNIADLDTDL